MTAIYNPDALLSFLVGEARRQKLTPQVLAKRADVAYSVAHRILNNKSRRPALDTVSALAAALELHFELRDAHGNRWPTSGLSYPIIQFDQ